MSALSTHIESTDCTMTVKYPAINKVLVLTRGGYNNELKYLWMVMSPQSYFQFPNQLCPNRICIHEVVSSQPHSGKGTIAWKVIRMELSAGDWSPFRCVLGRREQEHTAEIH